MQAEFLIETKSQAIQCYRVASISPVLNLPSENPFNWRETIVFERWRRLSKSRP